MYITLTLRWRFLNRLPNSVFFHSHYLYAIRTKKDICNVLNVNIFVYLICINHRWKNWMELYIHAYELFWYRWCSKSESFTLHTLGTSLKQSLVRLLKVYLNEMVDCIYPYHINNTIWISAVLETTNHQSEKCKQMQTTWIWSWKYRKTIKYISNYWCVNSNSAKHTILRI